MISRRSVALAGLALAGLVLAGGLAGCFQIEVPETIDVNFREDSPKRPDLAEPSDDDDRYGSDAPAETDWGNTDADSPGEPDDPARPSQPDRPADTARTPRQLPTGGGSDWTDTAAELAGSLFLNAERGIIFYAFDSLAYPGKPIDLAVRVMYAREFSGIENIEVGFYHDGDRVARARTNEKGMAIARWTPPEAGNYELTARLIGGGGELAEQLSEVNPTPLLIAARDKDTDFVIIDLDHTVVGSSFFRVLTFGAQPMADSVRVTRRIAKSYSVVYLTHRPDLLIRKSKAWLRKYDYPAGPLLVSELTESIGSSGEFKTSRIQEFREAYPNVKIGIGDKYSDAQAYLDHGLEAYLLPHFDPEDADEVAEAIRAIRALDAGDGELNVVDNWEQVETGIFRGTRYPAENYLRNLERLQRRLRRENEDDDEDEDEDDEEEEDD